MYSNPHATGGETRRHLYVKHSTSPQVAFDWSKYREQREAMFQPIVLKGKRLGVLICHDMYFGLLPHRLKQNSADLIIDLTGGDVNEQKWTNVLRARSRETQAPFLCTMAERGGKGVSAAFAYNNGAMMRPIVKAHRRGKGGFEIFDTEGVVETDNKKQATSAQLYTDITVALDSGSQADLRVAPNGSINQTRVADWLEVPTASCRVGVLALPIEKLWDPAEIYRLLPDEGQFDAHVVVYHSEKDVDQAACLDLMRLRAIEQRIGVALLAPNFKGVLKTNRYKNIQFFEEREGKFGLNQEFLGGPWSVPQTAGSEGLMRRHFEDYLALL